MSAAISTGYVNSPASAGSPLAFLSLYAWQRSNSPIGVTVINSQRQLGHLRHVRLHEQHRALRIQPQRQQIDRRIQRSSPQLLPARGPSSARAGWR